MAARNATKATQAASPRPGALEIRFSFTPVDRDGSDVKNCEAYSTPSMWAIADEWADEMQARRPGAHTDAWIRIKMLDAIALQAARAAGLVPDGEVSLEAIAELNNSYSVDVLPDDWQTSEGEAGPLPVDGEA